MNSWIFLICDECEHLFSFNFTYGCMKTGKAEVTCPECSHDIQLVHDITFQDGSVGINIMGATRGLHLEFTSRGQPT